jgi:long-chain acyl-CoA synthetase
MLTHRNLASNIESIRQALHLEPGKDVLLCVLPMFHAFAATVCMIFPLTHGCAVVPMPKFEPQGVADAIAAHHTVRPPCQSMFSVLLRLPTPGSPSSPTAHSPSPASRCQSGERRFEVR